MPISAISSSSSLYDISKLLSSLTDTTSSNDTSVSAADELSSSVNTITTDLSTLLQALESDNLSSVQSLASQLLQEVQQACSTADTSVSASPTETTGVDANPLVQDLSDLEDALAAGDTTSAQSILVSILEHLQGAPTDKCTASSPEAYSETSNPLAQDLTDLGEALAAGNTTSAQTILTKIMDNLSAQSADADATAAADSALTATTPNTSTNSANYSQLLDQLQQLLENLTTTTSQTDSATITA